MGDNDFTDALPSELGFLTKLQGIDVSNNPAMTGTIPHELGDLPLLNHIDVTKTSITGTVPEEMCGRVQDPIVLMTVAADCDVLECCL